MNEENREEMLRRIRGLTEVVVRINNSGEAITSDFRDRQDQEDEQIDVRSEDEKRRDLKDYILLRLQTMRVEHQQKENEIEELEKDEREE